MKLIKVAVIISLTPSLVFAELSKEAKFRVARLKKLATSAPARGFTDGIVKSASRTTTVTNSPTLDITKKKKPVMDKVRLRNGDVLSGKLIDMFDEVIVIKVYGNDIRLPWKEVRGLETVDCYRFVLSKGGAVDGPVSSGSDGVFQIATQVGCVEAKLEDVQSIDNMPAIARKKKELAEKAKFSLKKVWSANISVGLSDTTGNSESQNTSFSAEATRKTAADKLFLDGHFNRTKAAGVTSADAVRGGMRLDVNITKNRFYFLFGRLEVDKIKDLDMRSTVGAGLGNVFYDHARGRLDMGFGITYVRDVYEDAPKDSDRTFLYSLNWDKQISRAFKLKERLLVYPNLADFADYRIEADTKFDYALGNSLSITLGITNRYDAEPLPGKKEHDLTVTTSITKKY